MMKHLLIIFLLFFLPTKAAAQMTQADTVQIYTDTYRPYILPEEETEGPAKELVRMVVRNMNLDPEFEYIDYGFGYYMLRKSQGDLSFPWLKTKKRDKEVIFSNPVFHSEIEFFYNIRFHPNGVSESDLSDKSFGRVVNFSYGEKIDGILKSAVNEDRLVNFSTEAEAIQALLNGEIDILPQLSVGMAATLSGSFENQRQLVKSVPNMKEDLPYFVIAPPTAKGRKLIKSFNQSYNELLAAEIINPNNFSVSLRRNTPTDIATIVASEGFPVIIGVSSDNFEESFAIPPGTRVLILDWSDRILESSDADQLYKTMVDETLVLVLNGPHIGKELLVKNMHITIAE